MRVRGLWVLLERGYTPRDGSGYTTYLWGALPYWLIQRESRADSWRLSRFWSLYAELPMTLEDLLDLHCDFIDAYSFWKILDARRVGWPDTSKLSSTLQSCFDEDRVAVVFVDETFRRRLEGRYVHELLITGRTGTQYSVVGFENGPMTRFGQFDVSCTDIERAFESGRRCVLMGAASIEYPILSLRRKPVNLTDTSPSVCESLMAHLASRPQRAEDDAKAFADWWLRDEDRRRSEPKRVFGVAALALIAEHVQASFDRGVLPDYRLLHLNFEHKSMLVERLAPLLAVTSSSGREQLRNLKALRRRADRFRMQLLAFWIAERDGSEPRTRLFSAADFAQAIEEEIRYLEQFVVTCEAC